MPKTTSATRNQKFVVDTTHQLIPELGNRFVKSRISPSVRAQGVMAPGDTRYRGLLMLLELVRKDGVVAGNRSEPNPTELRNHV